MNILIIEDEEPAYRQLAIMLSEYPHAKVQIAGWEKSVAGAVKWLDENPPVQLVLMDIHLSDGLSFNIFTETGLRALPVVFTTAYDEYAIKAFEFMAIDYLLKPISRESLYAALEKLNTYRKVFDADDYARLERLINRIDHAVSKERFLVKGPKDSLLTIKTSDIAYFFRGNGVYIITRNNEKFLINYSLDKLAGMLPAKTFYRANRQFFINIESVRKIHTYFNHSLKVDLIPAASQDVIINKENAREFKEWLDQ